MEKINKKRNTKEILKEYKKSILDGVNSESGSNWDQTIMPSISIQQEEILLSKCICNLRELGVKIQIPLNWCSYMPWREIGSEIIRSINEHLNFTKNLIYKIIPLYLPIIISIISITISIIKSGN